MWSGALGSPIVEAPNFVSIKGLASPQETLQENIGILREKIRWWLWLPEHALGFWCVEKPHAQRGHNKVLWSSPRCRLVAPIESASLICDLETWWGLVIPMSR
ncbi:unnamed protein product [Brassica rapa subsp. trilocularis]